MSTITSAWLIGEFVLDANATVDVNGTPTSISAGR